MKTQKIRRIFVVDDDPVWSNLMNQMLQDLGYTNILSFSSGEECLKYLHLNPTVIFLDYEMEKLNGIQVLQHIKEYLPGTAVVICSAIEDINVAVLAMKSGSFDYLPKSRCGLDELANVIRELGTNAVLDEKIY